MFYHFRTAHEYGYIIYDNSEEERGNPTCKEKKAIHIFRKFKTETDTNRLFEWFKLYR